MQSPDPPHLCCWGDPERDGEPVAERVDRGEFVVRGEQERRQVRRDEGNRWGEGGSGMAAGVGDGDCNK